MLEILENLYRICFATILHSMSMLKWEDDRCQCQNHTNAHANANAKTIPNGKCEASLVQNSAAYGAVGFVPTPTASDSSTWTEYVNFVERWGSHVITGVHSGAMVEILTTATSTSTTDESDFQLQACLAGSGMGISASACVGYSTSDYEAASTSGFSTASHFYGGDNDLAVIASLERSTETIEDFLMSGDETTAAYYSYTPIWDLLDNLYTSGDNRKRLQILEAYYSTFLVEYRDAAVDECSINGVDYQGHGLGLESSSDYLSCQASCAANNNCDYWAFTDACYFKNSVAGFELQSDCVSGPSSCGTKQEAGYEILVTESDKVISFDIVACEFPIADADDCNACGNYWETYQAYDQDSGCSSSCTWWNCEQSCELLTLEYCSSPEMKTLPDDWVSRIAATSHYSDPASGCLADETPMTINGFDGHFCGPACEMDGTCTADVPEGVTAAPQCSLTSPDDGTKNCGLICDPKSSSDQCGLAMCMSSPLSPISYCMYEFADS